MARLRLRAALLAVAVTAAAVYVGLRYESSRSGVGELTAAYLDETYSLERSRFLTLADGTRLHYVDEGNPEGPPLLLIHGAWSSLFVWDAWVEELGADFRIVRFDLPGHGLTGPSASNRYDADTAVAIVDQLRAALGVARLSIAGNSVGGHVAWRYALERPNAVDAIVVIDATGAPTPLPEALERAHAWARLPILWRFIADVPQRHRLVESARAAYVNEAIITDALVDRAWELMRYPGQAEAMARAFRSWPAHDPRTADIGGVSAPTLILWGEGDAVIPLEAGRWYAEAIENAQLITYRDVGHSPMQEAAHDSATDTRAFLLSVLSQGASPIDDAEAHR